MKKLCIGLAMFFASLFTLPAQEGETQPPRILGFRCSEHMQSIDVSSCPSLIKLILQNCGFLRSLDVSKNIHLEVLNCLGNELTNLDLSNNTALTILYCDNNELTSLDLSQNTALTTLGCSGNHIPLSDLYKAYIQNPNWDRFSAYGQSATRTLSIDQVLDLSSERLLGESLSTFEISPDAYTENNFTFQFEKAQTYTLTIENTGIRNHIRDKYDIDYKLDGTALAFTYYISVEIPEEYYTVQVASNNPEWGTATVTATAREDGLYIKDTIVTITATPNAGYRFVNWTNNSAEFSTEAVYKFAVTENLELTANFEKIPSCTVSLSSNNPTWGNVSQSGDGTYEKGTKVTVTATANEGYRFIDWTKDGAEFSKESVYTFAVTEDLRLTANFEKKSSDVANENRDNDNFYVYAQERNIVLSEERGLVQVFNAVGQCVYSGKDTVIPVGKSGVYIIRAGTGNYKVIVL